MPQEGGAVSHLEFRLTCKWLALEGGIEQVWNMFEIDSDSALLLGQEAAENSDAVVMNSTRSMPELPCQYQMNCRHAEGPVNAGTYLEETHAVCSKKELLLDRDAWNGYRGPFKQQRRGDTFSVYD